LRKLKLPALPTRSFSRVSRCSHPGATSGLVAEGPRTEGRRRF
jgi:hypothetical protein